MKSVLVIGMGRFGRTVAKKMQELGNDVMIVDKHENIIDQMSADFTDSYIGDCTNEAVIKALEAKKFDICYVATGENFQSSLVVTMLLKRHGARHVVSKANQEIQAEILLEIGADEVINPEKEMAEKLAVKHSANNVYEYIPLSNDHSIYEIKAPKGWVGRTIGEIGIRQRYNINIVAIKSDSGTSSMPSADYLFKENDHVILIGSRSSVTKIK